ncbi:hypothetical protein GCM10027277_06150 [Pseudoduganella ginsengisoli]|uniref:SIMPL domain-containing protein n=1 Tax=Pseudoduganella ginsengisoli TaxID=1462440 RepID=UPI0014792DDC|nr:SIMPL domain-containing protein [Pseudoduganella ginsengisoli]
MLKSVLAAPLLAAALAAGAPSATAASALPDYPFIHASGQAFVFVQPNVGEIDFEISASRASPDAAVALIQQHVAEIQQLMSDNGVADSDITFSDVRRELRKGADPAAPEYDVKCTVHINVRDLGKWRAIMEPLIAKPDLDAFATTHGTTERKKIEQELIAQAVHEAQDKAQAMASGFGKKVGAVAGISSGEVKNISRSVGLAPSDIYFNSANNKRPQQDRSDLLMVGAMKMAQSVDVIFKIK